MGRCIYISLVSASLVAGGLRAQDPHFSQFFTAPATVNPALTGTGQGKWRVMTNQRRQEGNVNTAYNTFSLYGEWNMGGGEASEASHWGAGLQVMQDKSMYGNFKGTHLNGSLSYQLRLDDYQYLGLGMSATQSQRRLDAWSFSFGEQFRSGGFDLMLPNGEPSLASLKPYLSLSTGLVYIFRNDVIRFEGGSGIFHVNRPLQSFIADPLQRVPMRVSLHASLEYRMGQRMLLATHALYQRQAAQQYMVFGSALAYDLADADHDLALMAGLWYRTVDAAYPFFGVIFNAVQISVSYDIPVSAQAVGATRPSSFELSLIVRQPRRQRGVMPCPTR